MSGCEKGAFSVDDEQTWETSWVVEFTRRQ
jgi:hypothetical protein